MAAYTTIDNPELYFQCKIYTGTAGAQSLTLDGSEDMQPDLVWLKRRDGGNGYSNMLYDSVRGATKHVKSNDTSIEVAVSDALTGFDSDGFTLGANTAGSHATEVNYDGGSYVAWCWKAGTAFSNDASATSVGNTDSSGSASSTAGFSISKYAGVGSSLDIVVKHGLSVVPAVMITKNREDANNWGVYHHKNTSAPETDYLRLDATTATTDNAEMWADTAPTSAVFTAGDHSSSNRAGNDFVSYHWNEVQGFSKMGSYSGTADADGPFIFLGFKPAWFMTKKSNGAKDWNIYDNKRSDSGGGNANDQYLEANTTAAEQSGQDVDFLSNGVKIRSTSNEVNGDGNDFVYMAFAESPFCNSNGVPANAS